MATNRVLIDENDIYGRADIRMAATKKLTTTTTAVTRRAALGDLVNRTEKLRKNIGDTKKGQAHQHVESENKVVAPNVVVDLKKVKPRVETWVNKELLRKPSTRSISVKPTVTSAIAPAVTLVKTRTSVMPTVAEVKYINKKPAAAAIAKAEKSKSPEREASLKRQESNLTRKKVRAAAVVVKSERILAAAKIAAAKEIEKKKNNVAESGRLQKKPSTAVFDVGSAKIADQPVFESRFSSHSANLIGELNIDNDDEFSPQLVSEYVNDIYSYLFHMEAKYAIQKNHLEGQKDVFPKMRSVLIDWINEVHFQYRFAQETFHMAVSIIDRYLQVVKSTSRQNLQLVGVAALFIASKYEELYPPEIRDFVYITDDTYTKEEVLKMEQHILKKLKFELGCPLSIHFLRRFAKAARSDPTSHTLSKYFIELASVDYQLCEYLPSEIAAASLFIALYIIKSTDVEENYNYLSLWTPVLQHFSTYNLSHLWPIIEELAEYIMNAPTSKLTNVYKKYSMPKMNGVAMRAQKARPILQHLLSTDL